MEVLPKDGWFKKGKAPKEPMLAIHAMGNNPHDWLNNGLADPDKAPMPLQVLDDGHPLFMMYARGTEYSRQHETYAATSAEFWDFTWEEIGNYDVAACLDYVYDLTGKKSNLSGFSMGTSSIFAALTLRYDFFKERTNKVVLMSPCTITAEFMYPTAIFNVGTTKLCAATGIFEIGGPTWASTSVKLAKIIGVEGFAGMLAGGWGANLTSVSLGALYHYAQNAKQDRFQRYAPNYWSLNPFDSSKADTELYDLSVIQDIPIGLFIGAADTTCTPEQDEITRDTIGAMV